MKVDNRLHRMLEGARNYAAADRSDPFAHARALTHIRMGIAGLNDKGEDAFYEATPYLEERITPTGVAYMATVYRNIRRP